MGYQKLSLALSMGLVFLGACGAGDSSGGFKSIKNATPAPLSEAEKNAVKTVSGKVGSTGNTAASGAVALTRASNALRSTTALNSEFDTGNFNSGEIPCNTGNVKTTGSFNGKLTGNETNFGLEFKADVKVVGDQCKEPEGSFDGILDADMSFKIKFSASEDSFKGSLESIVGLSGSAKIEGLDEDEELKEVSVVYNKFRWRLFQNFNSEQDFDQFETLYDEDGEAADQVNYLLNNSSCSGTITINDTEYDCASVVRIALES